jgi:hypothetical protein
MYGSMRKKEGTKRAATVTHERVLVAESRVQAQKVLYLESVG